MKTITLRDANQGFARWVREVEAGEEFTITRNGVPVARLAPIAGRRVLTGEQRAAYERMIKRMAEGVPLGGETFDRDSLHER